MPVFVAIRLFDVKEKQCIGSTGACACNPGGGPTIMKLRDASRRRVALATLLASAGPGGCFAVAISFFALVMPFRRYRTQ